MTYVTKYKKFSLKNEMKMNLTMKLQYVVPK